MVLILGIGFTRVPAPRSISHIPVCNKVTDNRFRNLGRPGRIWAISAIHGDVDRLTSIHDTLYSRLRLGDRIVYHGNYAGYSSNAIDTINEILTFRRGVLAMPGMMTQDLVYLRGSQEEMWQKLLQLQFAPDPSSILLWMLGNGVSNTLYSYGISPHDGIEACRGGVMALTKWTNAVREAIRRVPGHETFGNQLLRAAYTAEDTPYPMLFVHAGIDRSRPLIDQGDAFWWAAPQFESITEAYNPFQKVVRGFDPEHKGVHMNCVTATIDGGCGFGGDLVCAGFDHAGEVVDFVTV